MIDKSREGIKLVKRFLDDVEYIKDNKMDSIDFDFYSKNFEKLAFYISKSLINDNFEELFFRINKEVVETVFRENVYLNPELSSYSEFAKYLVNKQYFKVSNKMLDDLNFAFKIIRNNLCHFSYKINDNIIIFDDRNTGEHFEFSIASLIMLLSDTLCSHGQSSEKGAYEYLPLLNSGYMYKIQNVDFNDISPSFLVDRIVNMSYSHHLNDRYIPTKIYDEYIRKVASISGKYYIKKIEFDNNIIKKAHISKLSNKDELDMYMCAFDDVKRAGISYKKIIYLLFLLKTKNMDGIHSISSSYYSIFSNVIFISYMSLVFDDYFINNFNGIINTDLFYEKPDVINQDIPRKFRNSLAHSRYRFEDIFDSSKGIIIEFWDENKGIINFKCKITKENAILLINEYLDMLDKSK